MNTVKIFTSGNSQAVRLPRSYRMKGKEAVITKVGDALIILPKKNKWDSLFDSLNKFSDDFMSDRIQPEVETRDELFK